MNPTVYNASLLAGVALIGAGVALVNGPAALIVVGVLVVGLTMATAFLAGRKG